MIHSVWIIHSNTNSRSRGYNFITREKTSYRKSNHRNPANDKFKIRIGMDISSKLRKSPYPWNYEITTV